MKTLMLATALFLSVNTTNACSNPEAQFIGKVADYNAQDCSFKVDFTMYNESIVCPLNSGEASETSFVDKSCSLKNGDFISGYLILVDGKIVIE